MKFVLVAAAAVCIVAEATAQSAGKKLSPAANCHQIMFEGDVKAGQSFEKVFTTGLRFYLEPLPSGWIVRVLATNSPRGPHDYAELATPPYKSVSALLVSTDWAFRAQDAIAWNPRHFRYVGSAGDFHRLESVYDRVMANDARAMSSAAAIVATQPEAQLQILDATLAAGVADQGRMASMVAQSLEQTPHEVDRSSIPSPLGKIEELRFRVVLTLPPGTAPASGASVQKITCAVPTT